MSADSDNEFHGPLFIVGMPRSGTKLLRDVLNRNQAVMIPRIETEFLPYIMRCLETFGDISRQENFERFFIHISKYPFFFYLAGQGSMITAKQWYFATKDYTTAGIFESLIRLVTGLGWSGDGIWGDKSPSYIDNLPLLKKLYPQAKFIHIVRDVRDYCLSINKAWGKNKQRAAYKWAKSVQKVASFAVTNAECICQLRYEDFLQNPEEEIRRIAQFIGISFSEAMLTLDVSSENIGDAKGKLRIITNNTGKYRTLISRWELRRIEQAAFAAMTEYGYTPEVAIAGKTPGWFVICWLQLLDAINLVRSARREMGLWGAIRFHFLYKRATSYSDSLK